MCKRSVLPKLCKIQQRYFMSCLQLIVSIHRLHITYFQRYIGIAHIYSPIIIISLWLCSKNIQTLELNGQIIQNAYICHFVCVKRSHRVLMLVNKSFLRNLDQTYSKNFIVDTNFLRDIKFAQVALLSVILKVTQQFSQRH